MFNTFLIVRDQELGAKELFLYSKSDFYIPYRCWFNRIYYQPHCTASANVAKHFVEEFLLKYLFSLQLASLANLFALFKDPDTTIRKQYLPSRYLEEKVIPVRKKLAKDVTVRRWDKSPHVGHLRWVLSTFKIAMWTLQEQHTIYLCFPHPPGHTPKTTLEK